MDKMDLPGIDDRKLKELLKKDFEDCICVGTEPEPMR